jgi:hypothetical protein
MEVVVRPLFMEWKRFLPSNLSQTMLDNILKNKLMWQQLSDKEQSQRSSKSSPSSTQDVSHNNATIIVASHTPEEEEERSEELQEQEEEEELREFEEEEENVEDGEEGDTLENDVNLAFRYQTETESGELTPVSEEEQLMRLAARTGRRHSMPVAVRKDLAFYMGLRRDSFTRSHFQRRQSLPATHVQTPPTALLTLGMRVESQGQLSVDRLTVRPKISSLSAALDTRLDHLHFLPLSSQTRLMQQPLESQLCPPSFSLSQHNPTSCTELRRRSLMVRGEDIERYSGVNVDSTCRQKLVGLASSWPSVLKASHKVSQKHLHLLGVLDPDPTSNLPTSMQGPTTVNNNNNHSPTPCLSSAQTEAVSLLSRPH